jgi:hypothetical protein
MAPCDQAGSNSRPPPQAAREFDKPASPRAGLDARAPSARAVPNASEGRAGEAREQSLRARDSGSATRAMAFATMPPSFARSVTERVGCCAIGLEVLEHREVGRRGATAGVLKTEMVASAKPPRRSRREPFRLLN